MLNGSYHGYVVNRLENGKRDDMYYNYYDDNNNKKYDDDAREPAIDFEGIRSYFMNYYGTAANCGYPVAMMDVFDVQRASHEELLNLARKHGLI